MGWITGGLSFTLLTLLFTFCIAAIQKAEGLTADKDRLHDLAIFIKAPLTKPPE